MSNQTDSRLWEYLVADSYCPKMEVMGRYYVYISNTSLVPPGDLLTACNAALPNKSNHMLLDPPINFR